MSTNIKNTKSNISNTNNKKFLEQYKTQFYWKKKKKQNKYLQTYMISIGDTYNK